MKRFLKAAVVAGALAFAAVLPQAASAQPPPAPAITVADWIDLDGIVTNFGTAFALALAGVLVILLVFIVVRKIVQKLRYTS